MSQHSGLNLPRLRHRYVVKSSIELYLTRSQVARWKDAQQQWKEAVGRVTNESKERQGQLASERDAAISQNEATGKELESAKAELQRLSKQNQDLTTSAVGRTPVDTDSVCSL
jgi:predicted  nucleic acid-binding Zn-ribbon protein